MALIKVKSAKPESGEVSLWEQHPDHPGGEVWVSGEKVVEVAETSEVLKKLGAKAIVKVEDGAAQPVTEGASKKQAGRSGARGKKTNDPQDQQSDDSKDQSPDQTGDEGAEE
jgi:hypothetical protein